MNSILQCFCHIEKFVNFFKYNKQPIQIIKQDKNNLSSSFKLLIEKLWPNNLNLNNSDNKKYYSPNEFKDKLSKMNPLFKDKAANDAKELVNFIIMTLHKELNKVKKSERINNNINYDQRNSQIMFNNFANNFMLENQSIISDLFYGINCYITQCDECLVQRFNYQSYIFLIFPLEDVYKFKLSKQMNFNNNCFNNNLVNIYDCFDFNRKIYSMTGENSMYCNYCKKTCNCSMCTVLTIGPEILILLLGREKGNEFNVKINFVEYLNLANYIQYTITGCNYKLIGVITHIGERNMGGH